MFQSYSSKDLITSNIAINTDTAYRYNLPSILTTPKNYVNLLPPLDDNDNLNDCDSSSNNDDKNNSNTDHDLSSIDEEDSNCNSINKEYNIHSTTDSKRYSKDATKSSSTGGIPNPTPRLKCGNGANLLSLRKFITHNVFLKKSPTATDSTEESISPTATTIKSSKILSRDNNNDNNRMQETILYYLDSVIVTANSLTMANNNDDNSSSSPSSNFKDIQGQIIITTKRIFFITHDEVQANTFDLAIDGCAISLHAMTNNRNNNDDDDYDDDDNNNYSNGLNSHEQQQEEVYDNDRKNTSSVYLQLSSDVQVILPNTPNDGNNYNSNSTSDGDTSQVFWKRISCDDENDITDIGNEDDDDKGPVEIFITPNKLELNSSTSSNTDNENTDAGKSEDEEKQCQDLFYYLSQLVNLNPIYDDDDNDDMIGSGGGSLQSMLGLMMSAYNYDSNQDIPGDDDNDDDMICRIDQNQLESLGFMTKDSILNYENDTDDNNGNIVGVNKRKRDALLAKLDSLVDDSRITFMKRNDDTNEESNDDCHLGQFDDADEINSENM